MVRSRIAIAQPSGNLSIMQYETRFSEDTCNLLRSSEFLDVMFDTRRIMILSNFATNCYAFLSNCFSIHVHIQIVSVVPRTLSLLLLILFVFYVALSSSSNHFVVLSVTSNVYSCGLVTSLLLSLLLLAVTSHQVLYIVISYLEVCSNHDSWMIYIIHGRIYIMEMVKVR